MDNKQILKDPQAAIIQRWGSIEQCPASEQITSLITVIGNNTKAQKKLKKDKQHCASQFKLAKDDPEQLATLKQTMQQVSAELNQLTDARRELENQLQQLFDVSKKTSPTKQALLPSQFLAQPLLDHNSANTAGKQSTLIIKQADDQDAAIWDAYVGKHSNASLYHQYQWRQIIETSLYQQCFYLIAHNSDGDVVGILPMTNLNSRLFGNFAVSLPYFNYGGPLANSLAISKALVAKATELAAQAGWQHIELRSTASDLPWPSRRDKVSMIKALPDSQEALDQQLGSKLRAQINRASREAVTSHVGHKELLDDFYRVFAINMRDLGTPVYSKAFFAAILEQLGPKHSQLIIIKHNNVAVSAAFLLGYKEMLEIPWASTLKAANKLSINMFLYRQVLGYAVDHGYPFFDFGRSTADAGTYKFKKQWGAKPVQHYWYYPMSDEQSLPQLNPDNPKFLLAIKLWKMLPVWITKLIGPAIVRNLP